jgi:AraC-like DNA-binding protein
MKLYIKYMASTRSRVLVSSELEQLGPHISDMALGEMKVTEKLTNEQHKQLKVSFLRSDLEQMDDRKATLIEKIKTAIIEVIHYAEELPKMTFSEYLSRKLNHDYTYMSNIFSAVTGTTIEHFIITNKIEKVKDLLLYEDLSLTQISYLLNYSSVAHLSNQFKKVTGLTPTFFKQLMGKQRSTLAQV